MHCICQPALPGRRPNNGPEVDRPLAKLLEQDPDGELATQAAYLRAEASYQQGRFDEAIQRTTDLAAHC